MPRKPNPTDLEAAIQDAADDFVVQILGLVRNATVDELAALTSATAAITARKRVGAKAAPKKRGRPAKAVEAAPARKPGRPAKVQDEAPKKKARKKRAWPKCTAKGCDKNVYMPSGPAKMCYQHYLEQGGKPSPLVKYRKDQAGAKGGKATPKASPKASPKAPAKGKKKVAKKASPKATPKAAAKTAKPSKPSKPAKKKTVLRKAKDRK